MNRKLTAGSLFPAMNARNIHGAAVSSPDSTGKWVHLQFRRYSGCSICNLHLQSILRRHTEIEGEHIREIVVFHSNDKALLPYQGNFPFDVIGDPDRKLNRQYGVESSLFAILNPGAWLGILKGNLAKEKPPAGEFTKRSPLGLPADFLISPDGMLKAIHYGKHGYDQWSADELLFMTRNAS